MPEVVLIPNKRNIRHLAIASVAIKRPKDKPVPVLLAQIPTNDNNFVSIINKNNTLHRTSKLAKLS
jgi:hypothetical protein